MAITLPPLPDLPAADASPEALAQYERELDRFKAAAFAVQAEAAALNTTHTQTLADAADEPRLPTRASLVWQLVCTQAWNNLTGATTLEQMAQMVNNAEALTDAYLDEQPGAVLGA